ncbi:YraN family protein [Paraglaciecola sp. MB-3u-78]|uniref:YraN family protein n=1 Tax=Paraglaciecola sp. MB-3u-78 TaxID=2058332 RepID=UPI000C325800|nr:YraN family protein [Paraglaciecola sp. MB-3u-78]PKH00284.1 YraN family protein [Paraglaciecola sp. MB-3u-78]
MKWIKQALSPLIGNEAERFARTFLEQQGLTFIMKNYRCRTGEIDLVMQDGDELVFVEVKFRSQNQHGSAIEFFHASKKRKFESAVMYYMQEKGFNPSIVPHRIDLVGIEGKGQQQQNINWLKSV